MKRLAFIDIAKGIGIVLVVIAHIGYAKEYIFMFHMPLFFFLSGYLLKSQADIRRFFAAKFIQFIVPYIFYLIFVYTCELIVYFKRIPFSIYELVKMIGMAILGGRWLAGYTSAFWFISCFFISQQLLNLIITNIKKYYIFLIVLCFIVVSYFNAAFFAWIKFPLNANVIIMAIPIMYIGFFIKQYNFQPSIYFTAIVFLVGCIFIYFGYSNYFDMKYVLYGIPGITLFTSAACILFILDLSRALTKIDLLAYFFSLCGKASLVIMYLHQLIQLSIFQYWTANGLIRFALSIFIPVILYLFFRKYRLTRVLFLGSDDDFSSYRTYFKRAVKFYRMQRFYF